MSIWVLHLPNHYNSNVFLYSNIVGLILLHNNFTRHGIIKINILRPSLLLTPLNPARLRTPGIKNQLSESRVVTIDCIYTYSHTSSVSHWAVTNRDGRTNRKAGTRRLTLDDEKLWPSCHGARNIKLSNRCVTLGNRREEEKQPG